MKKRIIAFLLCLLFCVSLLPSTAFAASGRNTSFEESLAVGLKSLGLFQGVSETSFDLDRAPTRIEALVMLIRVLGKESEALTGTWKHPFTDVPQWADGYVGYAYENGLTKGSSETEYGVGEANAATYLTFVLRALGYSDAGGIDFSWDDPFSLARLIGILPSSVDTVRFWRADVVTISYAALPTYLKNSDQTLAQQLIAADVFTQAEYDALSAPAEETEEPIPEREIVNSENYHGHVYTGGEYSKKYHYEANCAGKNSHEITWEEVDQRGLGPCGVCVLK